MIMWLCDLDDYRADYILKYCSKIFISKTQTPKIIKGKEAMICPDERLSTE